MRGRDGWVGWGILVVLLVLVAAFVWATAEWQHDPPTVVTSPLAAPSGYLASRAHDDASVASRGETRDPVPSVSPRAHRVTAGPVDDALAYADTMQTYQPPTPTPSDSPAVEQDTTPSTVGDLTAADLPSPWDALAWCESRHNPRAVNPAGYYGLFQFTLGTWASVGGSGNPVDASVTEQYERAVRLQEVAGWDQWPQCADGLGLN